MFWCSLRFASRQKLLEFSLVVLVKSFQVVDLISMSFVFFFNIFLFFLENINEFLILSCNFIFEFIASLSKLSNVGLHFIFLLLGHKSFSHSIGNWTLIQGLVSLNSHLNFISNSDEKESSFSTVNGNLSDQLIKALRIKLLSDWTDTCISCLSWLKFMI